MSLSISEVQAKAGQDQLALVQDGQIFYVVLNTKYNMLDFNFI